MVPYGSIIWSIMHPPISIQVQLPSCGDVIMFFCSHHSKLFFCSNQCPSIDPSCPASFFSINGCNHDHAQIMVFPITSFHHSNHWKAHVWSPSCGQMFLFPIMFPSHVFMARIMPFPSKNHAVMALMPSCMHLFHPIMHHMFSIHVKSCHVDHADHSNHACPVPSSCFPPIIMSMFAFFFLRSFLIM